MFKIKAPFDSMPIDSFKFIVQSDWKNPPRNSSSAITGARVTATDSISILPTQSVARGLKSKIGVDAAILIASVFVS